MLSNLCQADNLSMSIVTSYRNTTYMGSADHIVIDKIRNIAFVSSYGSDTITSINLNNTPSFIGNYTKSSSPCSADGARGEYLDETNQILYFVSDIDGELCSLNVTEPSSMIKITNYTASNIAGARSVFVDTNREVAFVTGYTNDFLVAINVSNKSLYTLIKNVTDSSGAGSLDGAVGLYVDTTNNIAYTTSFIDHYICSYNVSNITNWVNLASYTDTAPPYSVEGPFDIDIDITRKLAFVTSYTDSELTVLNISNATNFVGIGNYSKTTLPSSTLNAITTKIDKTNNIAYVTSSSSHSVLALNISTVSGSLTVLNSTNNSIVPNSLNTAWGMDIDTTRNYIYVLSSTNATMTMINSTLNTDSVIVSSCTCPANNTNWNITEHCTINSDCDIGTGNLTLATNVSYLNINATVKANNAPKLRTTQRIVVFLNKLFITKA